MPQDSQDLVIGFPLFHDADLLDVMAPLEALGFLQRPRARMTLVGPEAGKPVTPPRRTGPSSAFSASFRRSPSRRATRVT